MKKTIAISSLLLAAVFLAGCGQKPVIHTQPESSASVVQEPATKQSHMEDKVAVVDSGCGQVKDADGNTYSTVLVGNQCWLATNLNVGKKLASGYIMPTNNGIIEKWCYQDKDADCVSNGGLYTWDEAMQYSTMEGAHGICPAGWHIPTEAEFTTLVSSVGTNKYDALKAGGSSGLNFKLLGKNNDGSYAERDSEGDYWSSTPTGQTYAYFLFFNLSVVSPAANYARDLGYPVRCLKN